MSGSELRLRSVAYLGLATLAFAPECLSAGLPTGPTRRAPSDQVALVVSNFSGEQPVARNVATVLNLQVWRTLRRAPMPNPQGQTFGRGAIWWLTQELSPSDPSMLQSYIKALRAQFGLIGYAARYNDGVVVQAFVAAPRYEDDRKNKVEIWSLVVDSKLLNLGLPRSYYSFSPMLLKQDIVSRFSLPSAIRMCAERDLNCRGSELGDVFRAIQHDGPWSLVVNSQGGKGWVNIPEISEHRSEIASFVGGLVAYARGDWGQATELLTEVIENGNVSTSMRLDAMVLANIAELRAGGRSLDRIRAAMDLNPSNVYAIKAYVMGSLKNGDIRSASRYFKILDGGISDNWVDAARAILE